MYQWYLLYSQFGRLKYCELCVYLNDYMLYLKCNEIISMKKVTMYKYACYYYN